MKRSLGLAMDVGTTTVSLCLADLAAKKALSQTRILNPQRRYGADVLRRIGACAHNSAARLAMKTELFEAIGTAAEYLCLGQNAAPAEIEELTFCANSAVSYLALGLDASPLGAYPYTLPVRFGEVLSFADLQLKLSVAKDARLWVAPLAAAFVGGDAVLGFCHAPKTLPFLFCDLGSNGELFLETKDALYCASAAAGPAFEGGELSCGYPAVAGAVDAVSDKDGVLCLHVIGEGEAKGICGSGYLSLLAYLNRRGLVSENGALKEPFYLTDKLFITTQDVRALLLSKAALRAGADTLLQHAGVLPGTLGGFCLSGSFGALLSPEDAWETGLFSEALSDRLQVLRDAALQGAVTALYDEGFRAAARDTAARAKRIDLATSAVYKELFLRHARLESR